MSEIKPGQIYSRQWDWGTEYTFIVGMDGEDAEVVLLPSGTDMFLGRDTFAQRTLWRPPNADGWYVERVDTDGELLCGAFLPDFQCAWALFVSAKRDENSAGGRARVAGAKDASRDELMAFDDAFGYGPEPFLGLDTAIAAIATADPDGPV